MHEFFCKLYIKLGSFLKTKLKVQFFLILLPIHQKNKRINCLSDKLQWKHHHYHQSTEPFDLVVVLSRSLPNCLFCGLASQAAHKMTASKAALAILLDRLTKSSPFTLQQQQPNYGCLKSWLKIFKPPAPLPKSLQQCVAESNLFSPRKQPQLSSHYISDEVLKTQNIHTDKTWKKPRIAWC